MTFALAGTGLFAPSFSTGWLWLAALSTLGAMIALARTRNRRLPPRPPADASVAALRDDTPAVVNMLANDATVTAAGFRATVIDLAARGWLRVLPPEDDFGDLGRVRPAATAYHGDTLRPARTARPPTRARTIHQRPGGSGPVPRRRHPWAVVAAIRTPRGRRSGRRRTGVSPVEAARSHRAGRAVGRGGAVLAGGVHQRRPRGRRHRLGRAASRRLGGRPGPRGRLVRVVGLVVRPTYTHTVGGVVAARRWLAIRARLAASGFGEIAPSSVDVGDRRLAYATAMCLAEGAAIELPLAREDHHRAWSSVGGTARLVRVKYPARIAYGMRTVRRDRRRSRDVLPRSPTALVDERRCTR
jgi:hypothetical protein